MKNNTDTINSKTNYTLEDLKQINLSQGRPDPELTDKEWQKQFNIMRVLIKPSVDNKMFVRDSSPIVNNSYAVDNYDKSEMQWKRYRKYINDVLAAIRDGEFDYCYYIYQISDLLKYENKRLQSRYRPDDRCFEVWLK